MAPSAEFKAFVEDLFAPFGPVSVRAMFGGAGIFADGVMFGLIGDERIYLKTDEKGRKAFEDEGAEPFTFRLKTGEIVAMSYMELPERLYDEPGELTEWARRAYDVALKSPTVAKKRRKRAKHE